MKILVTGSKGFIGKATMEAAEAAGHEAHGFDYPDDVREFSDLDDAFEAFGPDAVIHLAGVLGTSELFDSAHKAIDVNVHGTLNVLEACDAYGVNYVGITMPDCWNNVYQATKHCGKRLASAWHESRGVGVSHVRAFNAFGPGQKVHGVQKIVPTFATRAWRNEPIPVWGDGQQTVDLVYTPHIANMLVEATAFYDDQVFDAGTGVPFTVNKVAQMVLDRTGSTAGIDYLPMRAGEVPVDIVAKGDGWELLHNVPLFSMTHFNETVDWYKEDRP